MNNEPLIRLAKRENMDSKYIWMIRIGSFFVALIVGCLVFSIAGADPLACYGEMLGGAFGKATRFKQVAKAMIPLLGTALALAPCFKMRYWNIGAEGQITMGAIGAAFFAINCKGLPAAVLIPLMGITGIAFGIIWAAIPALFKARWNTNETLFTLMMNYIAIGIAAWLQGGPWEGKEGSQVIPNFTKNAILPKLFGINCGWVIIVLLVVLMYVYMNYTKHGYEIAVLGESENTARYAGMNVGKVIVRTACLSGGIAGLVGFIVCSGTNMTLYKDVAGGVGFTAITVCWLAQLNPFVMVVISLILAALSKGASTLQTSLGVPASVSDILTGIILLCMLGCEFFINYKMIFRGKQEEA